MNLAIIYFLVFLFSYLLTFIILKLAIRKSLLDLPNERSSHHEPKPRLGGIAVVVSWLIGISLLKINNYLDNSLYFALLSGLPLMLTGLFDDLYSLKPSFRMIIQFVSTICALYFLGGLRKIEIAGLIINGKYFLSLLAMISIIWSTNLFNFLDGIDGYISNEIIFIGFSIFFLTGDHTFVILSFAALGFIIWNWQPARIFMGDSGSTFIGFSVGIYAIYQQNVQNISIVVWLILTSLFWFDASLTLIRRIINKEKLSIAHRKHAYQRIVQYGFSHQKVVIYAFLINILIGILAYLANRYTAYNILILVFNILLLFIISKFIDQKNPFFYDKYKG